MRASLADPSLVRQAGRFVWLELDFDKPVNQPFLARRGVVNTPTLYVLDPADERATATHLGGLTLPELQTFLDQGEREFRSRSNSPAAAALASGDEALGRGRLDAAAAKYDEAIRLAPAGWPERPRAVGSLTWTLMLGGQSQACAETAAVEAPRMPRDAEFARVVLAGMMTSQRGGDAPWGRGTLAVLEPLAEEAVAIPTALRDHRFQIYQQLIQCAQARGDSATARQWSSRWLDEIESIRPKEDNERSALDIARVDAVQYDDQLPRILPALLASERAMPTNYNASLRVAQAQYAAKQYGEAIAACDRGLAHVTGPVGRCWLERTKAEAMREKGDVAGARRCFEQALASAHAIGNARNRANNERRLAGEIAGLPATGM